MTSNPPAIIEITDLVTMLPAASIRCHTARLTVGRGDTIAIDVEAPADGRHLLRILATLTLPESGTYRFDGNLVPSGDYRQRLLIKRRIGYVAGDAVMISNRTVRENLLLSRYYYENDLSIDLDPTMTALCDQVGLSGRLDRRPSELSAGELLKSVMIREMGKSPAVMLLDGPENFLGLDAADGLFYHLKNMIQSGTAVVMHSHSPEIIRTAGRKLIVSAEGIREAIDTAPP